MKIRKNLWAWLFSLFVFTIVSFRNAPVTWIAIGDSITYLNDHLDETGYRVSKGYLTKVTEKLKNVHYINRGRNGWTAVDFAKNIDQIDFGTGEVYTIFLGTNDWWQGRPVGALTDYTNRQGTQTFYGAIRVIMDKIRGLNPHASIILITPMQRADFVYIADHTNNAYGSYKLKNGQSLEMFVNAILEIAKLENLPAIDLYHDPAFDIRHMVHYKKVKNPATGHYQRYHYPWVSDLPFDAKTDEYPYPNSAINMTYDGLHPSNKGNRLIASRIVKVFRYKLKI